MTSVFWVIMPHYNGKWMDIFIGTRTTKQSAIKLAQSELLSNKWKGSQCRVIECRYDSCGNATKLFRFEVSRMGRASSSEETDWYHAKPNSLVMKMRKQYGIDANGYLVKKNIEPKPYSVIETLWN